MYSSLEGCTSTCPPAHNHNCEAPDLKVQMWLDGDVAKTTDVPSALKSSEPSSKIWDSWSHKWEIQPADSYAEGQELLTAEKSLQDVKGENGLKKLSHAYQFHNREHAVFEHNARKNGNSSAQSWRGGWAACSDRSAAGTLRSTNSWDKRKKPARNTSICSRSAPRCECVPPIRCTPSPSQAPGNHTAAGGAATGSWQKRLSNFSKQCPAGTSKPHSVPAFHLTRATFL